MLETTSSWKRVEIPVFTKGIFEHDYRHLDGHRKQHHQGNHDRQHHEPLPPPPNNDNSVGLDATATGAVAKAGRGGRGVAGAEDECGEGDDDDDDEEGKATSGWRIPAFVMSARALTCGLSGRFPSQN